MESDMIYYHRFFFDGAPLISFAQQLTAASCGSPVRLPAPCTPASHATLGWTYSPFELLETREGLGLVAIGRSRESGIFGFAIDCVSPKIHCLLWSIRFPPVE